MKLLFLVFILVPAIVLVLADNGEFKDFKRKFNKQYNNPQEDGVRSEIFQNNRQMIVENNQNPESTFTLGENEFSDQTLEEFLSTNTGLIPPPEDEAVAEERAIVDKFHSAPLQKRATNPSYFDWRNTPLVTAVKNQGSCGSCWAFAAVAALEGQYRKKFGKSQLFSEQQLVSCSSSYGNLGCNGGWMHWAFNYVRDKGITNSSSYPYTSGTRGVTGSCITPKPVVAKGIGAGWVRVTNSEQSLENAIFNIGPVTVAVGVDSNFQLYRSGVLNVCGTSINHAVTVVGYNNLDPNNKYWIVKNSWGTGWGQSGYINIKKGSTNVCNVTSFAYYPLL